MGIPVDVEELLLAGAGIDALAEAVPGVGGGEEGEGVGGELRPEPGDVVGGGGDGGRGGGGGGGGDAGGGVGGDGVGAGAEVGPCGGGGGGEEEEDEERSAGEQEEQRRHRQQPRRGAAARRERHRGERRAWIGDGVGMVGGATAGGVQPCRSRLGISSSVAWAPSPTSNATLCRPAIWSGSTTSSSSRSTAEHRENEHGQVDPELQSFKKKI